MSASSLSKSHHRYAIAAILGVSSILAAYYLIQSHNAAPLEQIPSAGQALHRRNAVRRPRRRTQTSSSAYADPPHAERSVQMDGAAELMEPIQSADIGETVAEQESDAESSVNEATGATDQNMFELVHSIAADTARKEGYIHRGVECNGCGVHPIQGIRYHCSNCYDFDLCETCEAGQIHIKTHVFYKVRVPAPIRGHIKHVAPVWYPGKPGLLDPSLSRAVRKQMLRETAMDSADVDALYDQFRCLAGHEWPGDPLGLGMAIDRKGFDKYFMPPGSSRSPPPNLIYDRIFAYYDTDNNGLIGFDEFLKGLSGLQDKTRHAKLARIFEGYDMDNDGYVNRKDFLRMFRAYYALSKDITREMIAHQEEDMVDDGARHFIESSAPISTAFTGSNLQGHASRGGVGKEVDVNGDLIIEDGRGALQDDLPPYADRNETIGNHAALRNRPSRRRAAADDVISDSDEEEGRLQYHVWPPNEEIEPEDLMNALGDVVPVEEITDPVDRSRVFQAQSQRLDAAYDRHVDEARRDGVAERWKRRDFYTDMEEGMTAPPGYTEPDSSDDELPPRPVLKDPNPEMLLGSRRASLRSRSSSKVRFEDDVDDTDHETRSNTSSRSIPVGERWGGFEISEPEKEVGKEILYQAVQQGFNDLLDDLFKEKEDQATQASQTRSKRQRWKDRIQAYQKEIKEDLDGRDAQLRAANLKRTEKLLAGGTASLDGVLDLTKEGALATEVEERIEEAGTGSNTNDEILPDAAKVVEIPQEAAGSGDQWEANGTATDSQDDHTVGIACTHKSTEPEAYEPGSPSHGGEARDRSLNEAILGSEICHGAELVQCRGPSPTRSELDLWLSHIAIDAESEARGDHGLLSFAEFEGKMVEDEDKGEGSDDDVDEAGKRRYWRKSAGLGRLAFVGTWLEMASF